MSKKVYAIYIDKKKYSLAIKSPAVIQEQSVCLLEASDEDIVAYNENILISYSRAKLVHRAEEIKEKWLEDARAVLHKIEDIEIK